MKVSELVEKAGLAVFCGEGLDKEITGGYVSDLLSDVMGNAQEGQIWLTLQNHMNVLAICSLKDLSGVVLVKGIKPSEELVAKAGQEGIALLGSNEQTFEISGKIYQLLA
jgi:serine kinase of HPr protein (carbohydrate metabolism regulator)